MTPRKLLKKLLESQTNIRFNDFQKLVESFGFELDRVNGSHHIYKQAGVQELINLQNVSGQVKPYQIKQFLRIVEKYNLQLESKE